MTENDELLLLRALLRASDYGVLLSDASRRDQLCNRRFCEIFQLDSLDTLQSQPDYVRTQLAPRLKDPEGFLATLAYVYADPLRILEDEVELIAPRHRLLRRYTAPVTNDIRNILTPLTIEMTLADQDDSQARAESLQAMRRQVDSLSLLTHRLLALARPATTERTLTDLKGLVCRIASLVQNQATLEDVKIITVLPRNLPPIPLDAVQIDQVLVNLVLNALQAMRATGGGTLRLSLDRYQEGSRIRVTDTGPGITPQNRSRLFDPFFTTRPDGAGLGLFSCRRIIEEHGGRIAVRNSPGRGAQFTVWLPEKSCDGANGGQSHSR